MVFEKLGEARRDIPGQDGNDSDALLLPGGGVLNERLMDRDTGTAVA